MKEIKAPDKIGDISKKFSIFTAGSIEMGKAENWQEKLAKELSKLDIVILNPRREEWDDSWEQTIENKQFNEQVTWELDGLDTVDLIVVYFDKNTESPITLLELGRHLNDNIVVCCPEGYFRKGNVDIVCKKHGIKQVDTLEDMITEVKKQFELFQMKKIIK